MNEPNMPRNSSDWDSIDIFLFSNGQQHSPPRKYHLHSDDLNWWDTTKTFLARSQYGSMHSTIDLYTVEGKKIEGPLELRNAAAYVAVKPPDVFIPAGYGKYLFKASRSREKRQERLSNSNDVKNDEKELFLDINTIEQKQGIITVEMGQNSKTGTGELDNQPQKNIERSSFSKLTADKTQKVYARKKSSGIEKGGLLRRNKSCTKFKNNENFPKTKNITLQSIKRSNKQPISSIYSRSPKTQNRDNKEIKTKSKTGNLQIIEVVNEPPKDIKVSNDKKYLDSTLNKVPDKDLSTVYKNNEIDVQSIILDTDSKIEMNDDTKIITQDKEHIQNPIVSVYNNKELNIKLRIKLEDPTVFLPDNDHLKNDKSAVTLIKKEKASQVNIEVILSKDLFTCHKNLFLNRRSICNIIQNEQYTHDNQEIFLRCTCQAINSNNSIMDSSLHRNIIQLPTDDIEKLESCCKCKLNEEKPVMIDQGIQMSVSSDMALSSNKVLDSKSENVVKDKISQQEDPRLIKPKIRPKFPDETKFPTVIMTKVPVLSSMTYSEKFVQTEWCNIMLQAKNHEDGRYTFHLPALSLLKQYKIDQI